MLFLLFIVVPALELWLLIKIGAVITRNTRRVRIHLSQAYPLKELFAQLVSKLVPS